MKRKVLGVRRIDFVKIVFNNANSHPTEETVHYKYKFVYSVQSNNHSIQRITEVNHCWWLKRVTVIAKIDSTLCCNGIKVSNFHIKKIQHYVLC